LDATGAVNYSFDFGGTAGSDIGAAIAIDSAGHAFVTGTTSTSDFPMVNAFQPAPTLVNQDAAFVTELDPALSGAASIMFSSYLGGSNTITEGHGIAVDGAGNAYVTGYTYGNFPTTPGAFQTNFGFKGQHPSPEAFVCKIGVQNTPAAAPGSGPAGGTDPRIAFATVPTSLSKAQSAGAPGSDIVGVMPPPLRPVTSLAANSYFLAMGSRMARMLDSGSLANAAISPIVHGDTGNGRRLTMLRALVDAASTDGTPADWSVAPVTTGGGTN
jgi:hypothetical protein